MTNSVLITGPDLAPAAVDVLKQAGLEPVYVPAYTAGEGLVEAIRRAQPVGIISRMGRIDAPALDAAPGLRVISKHGVGTDNIDVAEAAARGVPVLVATGANAVSVAEHAIALMFAVAKTLLPLDHGLRAGRWEKPGFKGRELAGETLGLVAFGAIARQTARFAKAFGMDVVAFDPFCPAETFAAEGVRQVDDLDALLQMSDVISLHSPLTPDTRNMINAERLTRMKPGAIIVNTARGGLIDEPALSAALAEGRIFGAGLDTFATEPPAPDHPFWTEPRLVMTPHIGGVTAAANARVGTEAAQGIVDLLAGKPLPPARIVNRAALAHA
ncbi:hydroxyacid dehydrogenase [Falsirhodobacter sp. 20TX0035]|uniref:hydroxyacid dehydrogenase n=1 Tax=Falsirhodobacter sp. 20TX0035 TaxID=3022019 RepID=UPI00232F35DF|nr:hydroxyacid dehydrogenase [Falsirhodobacter sp. 20TX0035]MDB6454245.1 hydroxyacid dehydrogenase [Falsirhodobacter sp. 20TX0035]